MTTHPAAAFVLAVGAAFVANLPDRAVAQPGEPYDILFISVDDLNDWVGYLGGHPQTQTPNIDRLAARGMAFMNAHSPSVSCNPSRTAILTGLLPSTTGVYTNFVDWRTLDAFEGIRTLPGHFRDSGYRTLGAGKIFHAHTFAESTRAGYNDATAWDAFYPNLEWQLPTELGPMQRPDNENPVHSGFDWAPILAEDSALGDGQVVGWVERQLLAETGDPRFIAAGIYRPHLPWFVPEPYFDRFPLEDVLLPATIENDLDDVPEIARGSRGSSNEIHDWVLETGAWQEGVQAYLASINYMDAMVGRLLDALDASGRAGRTIVVLWGDHGFHLGEKGRWRKWTLWGESTRVPFIVVAPGVTTPGSRTRAPVSLMDIYPTLTALAGLDTPPHVAGRSLVPLLQNPESGRGQPALITYGLNNHAVVSETHRYIRYADGSEELYDLVNDPNEWTNLAGDPGLADTRATLARYFPALNAEDVTSPPPDLIPPGP